MKHIAGKRRRHLGPLLATTLLSTAALPALGQRVGSSPIGPIASYALQASWGGVVSGDRAYLLADGCDPAQRGLLILDIVDPTQPRPPRLPDHTGRPPPRRERSVRLRERLCAKSTAVLAAAGHDAFALTHDGALQVFRFTRAAGGSSLPTRGPHRHNLPYRFPGVVLTAGRITG